MGTRFGQLVKDRMSTAGITQVEMAKRVGVSHATVSRVMAGLLAVPLRHTARWIDALGMGTDEAERAWIEAIADNAGDDIAKQIERWRRCCLSLRAISEAHISYEAAEHEGQRDP